VFAGFFVVERFVIVDGFRVTVFVADFRGAGMGSTPIQVSVVGRTAA
jgi:hypothetical protein